MRERALGRVLRALLGVVALGGAALLPGAIRGRIVVRRTRLRARSR